MGVDSEYELRSFIGGNWNDIVLWDAHCARAGQTAGKVTMQSTAVKDGTYAFKLDLEANANKAFLGGIFTESLGVPGRQTGTQDGEGIQLSVRLSAAPSNDLILFGYLNSGVVGRKTLVINTSRQLELWDGEPTPAKLYTSTTLIPTGAGTPTMITVAWDWTTVNNVWVHLWIGSTHEGSFDTGIAKANWGETVGFPYQNPAVGDTCPAGANRGCSLYVGSVAPWTRDAGLDMPHTTVPVTSQFVGLAVPTADHSGNQWSRRGSGPADHDELDEIPNDANTTAMEHDTGGEVFYVGSTVDPIPSPGTQKIQSVAVHCIGKEVDEDKGSPGRMFTRQKGSSQRDTNEGISHSTIYEGASGFIVDSRPGGGDWAAGDFDLSGGESKIFWGAKDLQPADPGGIQPQITAYPGPEIVIEEDGATVLETPDTPIATSFPFKRIGQRHHLLAR